MEKAADQWSQWLLHQRFGGNEDVRQRFMAYLEPIRDRVLDSAHLNADATVLDVGCDDGLLGFAALDRVGKRGTVIFSDLSADLLDTCRSMAEATGVTERCQFVSACLPTLDGLSDRSVDAAVLRSVLIYVEDKPAAFKHLHRVLRPGGLRDGIRTGGFYEFTRRCGFRTIRFRLLRVFDSRAPNEAVSDYTAIRCSG